MRRIGFLYKSLTFSFNCCSSLSDNFVKSDLKFNYYNRYIEFCLLSYGKDKHIFTKYAPNNIYSHENALDECISENEYYESQNKRFKTYKTILLITSIILSILIINNTKQKYKKVTEKYSLYEPETDYEYFIEIPSDLDPIFASELVFMKDPFNENKEKQEEYAAVLLSLARKQYVKITKVNESKDWDNFNTGNKELSANPAGTSLFTSVTTHFSFKSGWKSYLINLIFLLLL